MDISILFHYIEEFMVLSSSMAMLQARITLKCCSEALSLNYHDKKSDNDFSAGGAPPHYARFVREFLDEIFGNLWIRRCRPLVWAPRSPDLSPLDFFVWEFLKSEVYSTRLKTIQQLKDSICSASDEITPLMCRNYIMSFKRRLVKCVDIGGANKEQQ